jgi:hypothetical protein
VFAFEQPDPERDAPICAAWLCSSVEEEDAIEDRVGPVEPGVGLFYDASGLSLAPIVSETRDTPCELRQDEIPIDWRIQFPDSQTIVDLAINRLPSAARLSADDRLLRRRDCEYSIFRSIEQAFALPRIREGFATVDLFVDFANSITNRRKSRAGASLEHHARRIFTEEGVSFAHNETSEGSKRPDFLFPSVEAYRNPGYRADRLRMLAAKTTCKDRWRQILNEADRIPTKHLLTLQRGVSLTQFAEMTKANVVLVVPASLHETFEKSIRPHLVSLEQFIAEGKTLQ